MIMLGNGNIGILPFNNRRLGLGNGSSPIIHWYDTPIVSASYTKPDVSALPTLGVEKCKVPQTSPLIRLGNTTITDNGDGTYQWVNSTLNGYVRSDFSTTYLMASGLSIGKKYRVIVEFDLISGSVTLYFPTLVKFKETVKYTTTGSYTHAEIIDVTNFNPYLYYLNSATTGTTTEIKVKSISVQELDPQVPAYIDTGWVPPSDSDWTIFAKINVYDSVSDSSYSGVVDETTGKAIYFGQDSFVGNLNVNVGVCGNTTEGWIQSGSLSEDFHYMTLTYNHTTKNVDLYIDARYKGSQTSVYNLTSARTFLLGHYNASTLGHFREGQTVTFEVFDRACTDAEVHEYIKNAPYIIMCPAGDSTYNIQTGWQKALPQFLPNKENILYCDTAKGGSTAKSYYDDGWWSQLLLLKPKYVLMGWGQNDNTYGVSIEGEFKPYINMMIDEGLAQGQTIYLCTPSVAMSGVGSGVIASPNNEVQAQAIREIGIARGIPVLDVFAKEMEVLLTWTEAERAACFTDGIHYTMYGAKTLACPVIRNEMDRLGITLL